MASSPEWAWKFRVLEAEASLWRGLYEEALRLLDSPPSFPQKPEITIAVLTLTGLGNTYLHRFAEADHKITKAEELCSNAIYERCGDVIQARGILASQQGRPMLAEKFFQHSLAFAREQNNQFLESTSLLNLGAMSLQQARFDEAIDQSEGANQAATAVGARIIQLVAQGNQGWAYYRLGDFEKAQDLSEKAEQLASSLQDISDQENWLTNIGYIQMDNRQFDLASQSFKRALSLAEQIKAKQDVYNALRVLARLELETGNLDGASQYAERAATSARESGNHADELYPLLVQGQIAARRDNSASAKQKFETVQQDKASPAFLRWEAQHSLAKLYETTNQPDAADREYRAALTTFEAARADVRRQDSHLSFLNNGWRIYDDYIHFLVANGKSGNALRCADYSRARSLAEGLGVLRVEVRFEPPALRGQEVARGAGGTILFYWLGEKQSYLWAISAKSTRLITLPPASEIDAVVQRYRKTLTGEDLTSGDTDGRWLYKTLVAPAQSLLDKDARVFIIPDGSLNYLNFETLLVEAPSPHYWIEDATITNASSLRTLSAVFPADHKDRRLLLIGNTIAPNPQYPELPNAAAQMESVARHFPAAQQRMFAREAANRQAYLGSNPEEYSHIHFVTHGISSRLSPLDSAIVLSPSGSASDSFKLYGRDIIQHPLRADLVTISACYGAGERWYSGEGLVGLSWAFLRAGAHNVIAALWEVSDASVEKLMAKFYEEIDRGASPDSALRSAKLALLHSNEFRKPFYWAPFQLYTQGRVAGARRPANPLTSEKLMPASNLRRQLRRRESLLPVAAAIHPRG